LYHLAQVNEARWASTIPYYPILCGDFADSPISEKRAKKTGAFASSTALR
jgi:hypothetical protein